MLKRQERGSRNVENISCRKIKLGTGPHSNRGLIVSFYYRTKQR